MVKVTLSVPDELAAKIGQYRERLNQSAIFADAIRKEITRLEHQNSTGDLTATIERMRGSHDAYEKEHYQMGFDAGVAWARDRATYLDLKRVADVSDPLDTDPEILFTGRFRQELTYADRFMPADERNAMRSLQQEHAPFNVRGYQRGWFDGAKSIYNAVKDSL